MSQTLSTLSLRNLHGVFGEIDPVRRRATVDEIFHKDAVFYDPNGGIQSEAIFGVRVTSHRFHSR